MTKRDLLYTECAVTLAEVPGEISLCINIAGCPCRCEGCSEPWLQKWEGRPLKDDLDEILGHQMYFTCVTFMGGDADHMQIAKLADIVHKKGFKAAMYSGLDDYDDDLAKHLDYYKIGKWDASYGPLDSKTTNQRMYRITPSCKEDITYKFWPNDALK